MQQTHVFVLSELSKFVDGLGQGEISSRADLLSRHAYFKIFRSYMFSRKLSSEWTDLYKDVTYLGPAYNHKGRLVTTAVANTISQMSDEECNVIIERVILLKQKVATELGITTLQQ